MSIFEVNAQNAMQWSRMNSRVAAGAALYELAKADDRIIVLTADVAASAGLKKFAEDMPNRIISCGIAEQGMICIAAGLAAEGYRVFAFSFAPFASMRCFEQIRQYVGYMQSSVAIVGIASGLSMGVGGNTHYGLEDIALMRTIPNMTVLSPADCTETMLCMEAASHTDAPMYIRLTGVGGNPIVYKTPYQFEIGRAITLREGDDVALLATGTMVAECIRAARVLEKAGISASVTDVHTIKPIDTASVEAACKSKLIVTAEEHTVIGGLGDAVAAHIACRSCPTASAPRLVKLGINDTFIKAGDYPYVLEKCGLTAKNIAETIINTFKEIENV